MGLVRHRVEIHVAGSRVLAGIAACICLGAAGPSAREACAAPVALGGGFDYYSGPADQITRSALVIASVGLGPSGNASIAGLRFDDSNAGQGAGVTVALGLPVGPTSALKLLGSEFAGSDFRAWRVKAGPQASLPRAASLGVYYTHYQDNADSRTDGVVGELGMPLVSRLTGRASASYATDPGGSPSTQGSIGLGWTPVHSLELSGEVGIARNGALAMAPLPHHKALELPLIGGGSGQGSRSTGETTYEPTILLGVRALFP